MIKPVTLHWEKNGVNIQVVIGIRSKETQGNQVGDLNENSMLKKHSICKGVEHVSQMWKREGRRSVRKVLTWLGAICDCMV